MKTIEFTEAEKKTYTYAITGRMAKTPICACSSVFFFILLIVIIVQSTGMSEISEASNYDW